ncbi:MAG: SPOR domain-containing protein [Rubrivivax sp.]|nr:SPOR domain-containing protein [Rubrivivax sp.]
MKVPAAGQRGGFVMGLVVGLLLGLALALGVALYITKAPVPFINKVPQRTAEQDHAEVERNRNWDPNGALGTRPVPRVAASSASGAVAGTALPPGMAPAEVLPAALPRDPAAILAGGGSAPAQATAPKAAARPASAAADPFFYFVQAGAYTRSEDAEQQRARLALIGQTARITEREQVGRTVYRVRLGPLETRNQAVEVQAELSEQRIESQIVRVERP